MLTSLPLSDNVDLGTACGKYYRVCCLSILDPGSSLLNSKLFGHLSFALITCTERLLHMLSGDSDIITTVPQ